MRIIKESTLNRAIVYYHSRGIKEHVGSWKALIKGSIYRNPQELKQHYRNASIINSKRVVFNIKGNEFRLIVDIEYRFGIIYVIDFLTHEEYDKVDVEQITYEQSKFFENSA
jgi:mRNA interferase HigB